MTQTLVNLTSISIAYRDRGEIRTIEPSGIRLVAARRYISTGRRIGDATIDYVEHDLPSILETQFAPKENTLYIVDPVIAAAMIELDVRRDDVIVSHGNSAERGSDRQVIASRRFIIANPLTLRED